MYKPRGALSLRGYKMGIWYWLGFFRGLGSKIGGNAMLATDLQIYPPQAATMDNPSGSNAFKVGETPPKPPHCLLYLDPHMGTP